MPSSRQVGRRNHLLNQLSKRLRRHRLRFQPIAFARAKDNRTTKCFDGASETNRPAKPQQTRATRKHLFQKAPRRKSLAIELPLGLERLNRTNPRNLEAVLN